MTTAYRIDAGQLRKPRRTPQGFLRVDGYASRVGVFEYLNHDGSVRRELRPPEEVFRADSLASFEGAPLTDGHPAVEVSADNVGQYEVGTVTAGARRDGDHVATAIVVKRKSVIAKLERGDTGLSVGYRVDLDETPGTHPVYGRYDAIQRNIVVNHLAVGVQPRAGETARVRMDSAAVQIDRPSELPHGVVTMSKPNNEEMTAEEQTRFLKARNDELQARVDELEKSAKASKVRADELVQTLDVRTQDLASANAELAKAQASAETEAVKRLTVRADSADRELAELKESFPQAVARRAELIVRARTVLGSVRFDASAPDRVIQEAIIKHFEPTFRCDSLADHEIAARADVRYESRMAAAESYAAAGQVLAPTRNDAAPQSTRESRAKAWRDQAITVDGYKPSL